MLSQIRNHYDRIIAKLPPRIAAYLDLYLRPDLRDEYGGAFNNQQRRIELVNDLLEAGAIRAVIETGTYRGTTAEYFARKGIPVNTVELIPRYYHYARTRLSVFRHVHCWLGDSRRFLKELWENPDSQKEGVLFYLDAHWYENLPVWEEISFIASAWKESVMIVDDFRVPDDPGYGFDDYGAGKRLCIEGFDHLGLTNLEVFWPSAPASKETGLRRGCIVLVTKGSLIQRLAALQSLRHR